MAQKDNILAIRIAFEAEQFKTLEELFYIIKSYRLLTIAGISKSNLSNILHHPGRQPVEFYVKLARTFELDVMKLLELVIKSRDRNPGRTKTNCL